MSDRPTLHLGISALVQPHAQERSRAPLEVTPDAALLVAGGRIVAAGPLAEVRADPRAADAAVRDWGGRAVIPGLCDSHTHVVHAGDRVDEFARRSRGESYEEIARAGGGILRSVTPLRAASVDQLVAESLPRLGEMLRRGTTTVEAKSGYGLSPEAEHKHLAAIAATAARTPVQLLPTVLAHVIPVEARADRAAYVERFCREVIAPAAHHGLARYCDVFVETVAFTPNEARTLAAAATAVGLGLKLHVDQLHDGGGALLAAELRALSADHLEMTGAAGRAALADAGVVATLLPGCALFLGTGPWPDGRALRDAGCAVAVATDCNPGSSPITDLPLCATLAATRCGLSLEEALWGVTRGGALALGLTDRGCLYPGERADFAVVDHADWRHLLYRPAAPPVHATVIGGEVC